MHDIKMIRENPEAFDAALARRGSAMTSRELLEADTAIRAILPKLETAQAQANTNAKAIGSAIGKGDHDSANLDRILVLSTLFHAGTRGCGEGLTQQQTFHRWLEQILSTQTRAPSNGYALESISNACNPARHARGGVGVMPE